MIRRLPCGLGAFALLVLPRGAWAHDGVPPAPHDLWDAWPAAPVTALLLVAVGVAYRRGTGALRRRAGPARGISAARALAFAGGLLTVALALLTPLDAVAEALFSIHMVQHLLLVAVAAPLLVLGRPETALLWALPLAGRRAIGGWWKARRRLRGAWAAATRPLTAAALQTAVLWGWHVPAAYEAALANPIVHRAEHATLLTAGVLFWRAVDRPGRAGRRERGLVLLAIFVAAMQGAALGALITFAETPWYPGHAPWTAAWGLTPLQDQELAGLIMWVPVGPVYVAAAAIVLYRLLRVLDADAAPLSLRGAAPRTAQRSTPSTRSAGTR